jgi:hypothetical protein
MIRARSGKSSVLILALGVGLAGCNANPEPVAATGAELAQAGPIEPAPEVALPAGAACSNAIERWRAVLDNDYRTGYLDPSVYASAERDVATEQSACAAGRDADALRLVAASRRRHGYPPN